MKNWNTFILRAQRRLATIDRPPCFFIKKLHTKRPIQNRSQISTNESNETLNNNSTSEFYLEPFEQRTHYCGELSTQDVGQQVRLCGWIEGVRSLSLGLGFIPLRDSYGTIQLVSTDDFTSQFKDQVDQLTSETIVQVEGNVRRRPCAMVNNEMKTGDVEVVLTSLRILNKADSPLPFSLKDTKFNMANEMLRAKFRFLDLRRQHLQDALKMRSNVARIVREFLLNEKFTEVETPLLFKSTPEGAREFIVPTRKHGLFYALPQSPQQYKQILMASGVDRYFQLAKCFRDESQTPERQSEFTQIDIEMAFANSKVVTNLVERMIHHLWKQALGIELPQFPRMTFSDAIRIYGSDKPDTRFGMKIKNLDQYLRSHNSELLVIEAICIKGGAKSISNKELQDILDSERKTKKIGDIRAYKHTLTKWMGTIPGEALMPQKLEECIQAQEGDLTLISWRPKLLKDSSTPLGRLRLRFAQLLESKQLLDRRSRGFQFLWVEAFPLFSMSEEGQLESTHHPFTAPWKEDLEALIQGDIHKVRGQHYDLVLNGFEVGGGSVRIHSPQLQSFVLDSILKLSPERRSTFQHLLDALRFGCPPHAGIALGFDRLVSVMCGTESIRNVIAFPKSSSGFDVMVGSPSSLPKELLEEYNIQVSN